MVRQFRFFTTILSFILPLILLTNAKAYSHPHQFIDTHVTIVFDEKGLAGFRLKWVFDEMTAVTVMVDFDQNGNEQLDPAEVKTVRVELFEKLRKFNYMTYIYIEDQEFFVTEISDFNAKFQNDLLIYEFFVPCEVIFNDGFKMVRLSVFDEEYFTEYKIKKEFIHIENTALFRYEYQLRVAEDRYYYYGSLHPKEIALKFRKD